MIDKERFANMAEEGNQDAVSGTSAVGSWMVTIILLMATGIAYASSVPASS